MPKINIPFEYQQSNDSQRGVFAWTNSDLDVSATAGTEAKARKELKKRAVEEISEALRQKAARRAFIFTKGGEMLLVEYRLGSWGYQIVRAENSGYFSSCLCGTTFEEVLEYARNHAEQSYGGVKSEVFQS